MNQIGKMCSVVLTEKIGNALLSQRPKERNPTTRFISAIKKSIEHNGWMNNSVISATTEGELLDGQHRLLALKELGWPSIRVQMCKFTPAEADENIRASFNKSRTQTLTDTMAMVFGWKGGVCRKVAAYRCINRLINGDKTPNDELVMVAMDASMPNVMKEIITHHVGKKGNRECTSEMRAAFAITALADAAKTKKIRDDYDGLTFESTSCATRRIFDMVTATKTSSNNKWHGLDFSEIKRIIYAVDRYINGVKCGDLTNVDPKHVQDVSSKYIEYAKAKIKFA